MRILFKKIPVFHGKVDFSKIKGSVCNIPMEVENICNILPRLVVSSGLIVVKLKRDLKYGVHVYSELVRPHIVYQELTYLKSYNKFYENTSITKCLSTEHMIKFFHLLKFKDNMRLLLKNLFLMERK